MKYDKVVRIGVNWGSLDQELLAQFMDENAKPRPALGRQAGHVPGAGRVGADVRRLCPPSWA